MRFVQFLQDQFEGRGIFPTVFSMVSWIYLVIILLFTVCQFLLYIFKIKCNDKNFLDKIEKNNQDEV